MLLIRVINYPGWQRKKVKGKENGTISEGGCCGGVFFCTGSVECPLLSVRQIETTEEYFNI